MDRRNKILIAAIASLLLDPENFGRTRSISLSNVALSFLFLIVYGSANKQARKSSRTRFGEPVGLGG